jgi:radical SAM superfamily enzyme YgiQ (UPF0313 family)
MEPLVFAILADLTPPDVEVVLFDERVEPIPYDEQTDLVAITVETFTARRAYQIAGHYRERGIPVVMGGYHPTFVPDEALQYANSVVIGDAEGMWEQIVQDARAKNLRQVYRQEGQPSLQDLKFDRSLFKGKRYTPLAPVQYSRGCRFACDFCSIHAFYGSNLRQRPVHEVVAEIESLGQKYILIVDDNIFVDVSKAEELFCALIPLKIKWSCQVTIDIAQNTQLMDLMEKSGCIAALIGFESINEQSLRQMKKRWNLKGSDYPTAIQKFQDHGIMLYGSFIFGYDHDTVDIFDRTVEFALRSKFGLVNFSTLTPTPGARLYDRLRTEGRLLYDRWWLDPRYRYGDATFHPKQMSVDQLTEGCLRARGAFYRYSSIFQRAFDLKANSRNLYNLGLFLLANLVSKRELSRKLGRPLG